MFGVRAVPPREHPLPTISVCCAGVATYHFSPQRRIARVNHSGNIRRFQVVSQTQELLKKHGSGKHFMQHFATESHFGKHKKGGRKMSIAEEADFIAGRPPHAQHAQ